MYAEDGSPALVLRGQGVAAWNPPNLRSIQNLPLSQVWGNTGAPYALAAGVFSQMLQTNSRLHAAQIDLKQTMSIAAWRTKEGQLRILAGNLEEGLREDADFSRTATLAIPQSWRAGKWRDLWSEQTRDAQDGKLMITLPQAGSVLLEQAQ